jgi:uncharacterized protein (DUF58 family)
MELDFFKQVKRIELISTKLVENLLSGNYRSIFRGQGIEFDEVREYSPGDDIRLIDWNVTSRMGSPFTKTFREQRELSLFLIVDDSASLFLGTGEVPKNTTALLVFAVFAISAVANHDRVGAIFFTDRIESWMPLGKGKKYVLGLINKLMTFQPKGRGSNLALALRTVSESLKSRGICVIISDFKTTGYWEELTHLGRRHDVIAVKIYDPADYIFPRVGLIELEDPESKEVMLAEGISRRFRQRYRQHWEEHHLNWIHRCHSRGVETLELSTSDDVGASLVRFFQARKKRRRR